MGLDVPQDAVLGELDDFVTRSGFRITPVVIWAVDVPFTPVLAEAEVASIHRLTMSAVSVEPRFVAIPQSDRPVLQLPLLGQLIHAPTGAIVHQFAEVVLHGRATRVADVEQPPFAWK
ncbi:hypothetical protein [Aeromicrobium sp. UC242_57]|uniref:hypothetical protein n=1 Tax=Aeromicrobium sp. UC242_57 TaxID=3374624 RepID=UPI0037A7C4C4